MHYRKRTREVKIGNRYEYYIAWLLRRDGWIVTTRMWLGLHDQGIDIIAKKNDVTRYIQCKGWPLKRLLHEDVIDQLYGSVGFQVGPENISAQELYIYTSGMPSHTAVKHAEKLNIQIVQEPFPHWKRKKQFI